METQRRFHRYKIKCKAVTKTLHKPSVDKVTCVKQTLMQNAHVGEPDGEELDNDVLGVRVGVFVVNRFLKYCNFCGWLGGTTSSASDQRSEGCGFEAY